MRRPVVCVGAYILDILGWPIDSMPQTQNSVPVREIRLTVAGTAGGTAMDLAVLDVPTEAAGVVGDDLAGHIVREMLAARGVGIRGLVVRKGQATSATMLPVHADGTRAAWHLAGASATLSLDDLSMEAVRAAGVVHFGGVGALPALDGDGGVELLAAAHDAGAVVTADCLGVKRDDVLSLVKRYLPYVDLFLPNDLEASLITGLRDPEAAAEVFLELGARAVVVTLGANGALVCTTTARWHVPAYDVPVVDATGCGDAFTAGTIFGIAEGEPLRGAVEYGNAAAALTVQGLGSDAGAVTREALLSFLSEPPPRKECLLPVADVGSSGAC